MSHWHAFEKWKQMNKILESEFEYLLSTEEIAKCFYYEDNCFSTLLNRLLQSSKWSNLYKTPSTNNIGIEISQKETTVRSKEETKETSITPHQSEQLDSNQNDDLFGFINWVWFSGIEGSSQKLGQTSEFRQDESAINQDNSERPAKTGDCTVSDYARTMIWIDSNIPKGKEFTPNNDWSVNKNDYKTNNYFTKIWTITQWWNLVTFQIE